MSSRSIFCSRMLGTSGWVRDVLIGIDQGGRIVSLGHGEADSADFTLHGPVIPGMPNCHSHAFQRQMAGLAGFAGPDGADSFWSWREAMYKLAGRLNPEALQAIALWLYVEMLEAGYTSCAEFHYLHHQGNGQPYDDVAEMGARLLKAGSDAGLPLTLLPVLYCRAGFAESTVLPGQRRFANDPDRFLALFERSLDHLGDHPHHVLGLALHSLRAASKAQITTVLGAEGGRAAALHIHIAEQVAEVAQCEAAYGARPVQWLLNNVSVDARWCLVHATHMDATEYEAAASSGATAGLCPTTEADLGDGFFEAEHWLGRGGHLAIGSDSNLRVSPVEELRLLESGLRLRTGRRNVVVQEQRGCGRTLYETAAEGGKLSLGQPVGKLDCDFRADLVELNPGHPMLRGVSDDDLLDRYVFAGDKEMIRSVFVAGEQVVEDGRHKARDAAAAGFVAVMEELSQ